MSILLIIGLFFIFIFPFPRFIVWNVLFVAYSMVKNVYEYIRYKKWRECPHYGRIICYTGLFGQGKTKECVRFITEVFKKYNNKMIWDKAARKWITQKIVVYSNVSLSIPYVELTSLQQLVDCQQSPFGTVNLFLIDEASVVFNSREFKNNFSTPALNTILTSRHHKIGIYLTAQRFGHIDALLRQVTSFVYECKYNPFTHIQKISVYDAWDCENCTNLLLLKPLKILYTWTADKVYKYYDTLAMVSDISKKCENKDFEEDSVIAGLRSGQTDYYSVNRGNKRLRKRLANGK